MWEAIRANRRRSNFLIVLMGLLLLGMGLAIGILIDPGEGAFIGVGIAGILWMILTLTALWGGDSILLASAGAREIKDKKEAPQLWNIVEEMTIASGLGKMPRIYIIENSAPNAFAAGRNPDKAVVAVTTGLLKRLNRDELQGVIAHEIAHVKNLDVRFMTIAAVTMGTIIILGDIVLRMMFYTGRAGARSRSSKGGKEQLILFAIALIFIILAPIFAQLLYFACSRKREYLADASAARFTRYPDGLASALEKISRGQWPSRENNRTLAPLYIVNPLQSRSAFSLFSTHPPTEKRIQILRSMAGGASYHDYEKAYKQVFGDKRSCLHESALREDEKVERRKPIDPQPEQKAKAKQDWVQQTQRINDLFEGVGGFLFLGCACGMRFKIPPGFLRQTIACPKCGKANTVPTAK